MTERLPSKRFERLFILREEGKGGKLKKVRVDELALEGIVGGQCTRLPNANRVGIVTVGTATFQNDW